MLATLLPITGPVMVCVLLGFLWKKFNWAYDTQMVTHLVMRVGAPCLIISSLSRTPVSRAVLEQMFVMTAVLVVIMMVAAALVIRLAGQPLRTYLGPLVFPNTGNMGLPVCLFAFGEKGLTLALAFFMLVSITHFTVGLALVSGRSVLKEMVSNPIVYSIAAAVFMIYGHVSLPHWVENTVQLLGQFTIPLMLLTLGVSLAGLHVHSFGKSLYFALARLGIGVAAGWGVATLFGVHGTARGVLILEASMPVAVFNYLFAMQFNREPQIIAGMVMISTLLSFLLIPLVLLYVV